MSGNVAAGSAAFQITFGTNPWVKNGKPYQPVVLSSSPLLVVSSVTASGFIVKTVQGIGGASTVDVGFSAWAG